MCSPEASDEYLGILPRLLAVTGEELPQRMRLDPERYRFCYASQLLLESWQHEMQRQNQHLSLHDFPGFLQARYKQLAEQWDEQLAEQWDEQQAEQRAEQYNQRHAKDRSKAVDASGITLERPAEDLESWRD